MQIWHDISQRASPFIWFSATAISLVLLAAVISQVDWHLAGEIALKASPVFLAFSFFIFLAEGVFTTLRIYLLTPNHPGLTACFKVTAWYVVFLILLPARLGEVAAILLLKQHLNQNTSPALMNILVQRLFDIIILGSIFLITVAALSPIADSHQYNIIAITVVTVVSIMLIWFDRLLAIPVKLIIYKKARLKNKWLRHITRMLLQARTWHRHRLTPSKSIYTILLTIGKWGCNLGGFVFLLKALQLPLTISNSVMLGAAYNFLSIIPIQTIGGFGISEAGLTSLLLLSGLSLTLAASATILVRLVIIIMPFAFWCIVMGSISLISKREMN